MLEHISLAHVVQWIAVVFAAGFIGFFGKHLGQAIITRIQGKKMGARLSASSPAAEAPAPSKEEQKAAKKQAKHGLKQIKKRRAKPS